MPRRRIKAGKLRHRVTILDRTDGAADGSGGRPITYVPIVPDAWASFRQATEFEVFNSGRINNVITHVVRFRWRADLKPDNRLLFRGKTFEIVSVNNVDELNRVAIVKANEIVQNP